MFHTFVAGAKTVQITVMHCNFMTTELANIEVDLYHATDIRTLAYDQHNNIDNMGKQLLHNQHKMQVSLNQTYCMFEVILCLINCFSPIVI